MLAFKLYFFNDKTSSEKYTNLTDKEVKNMLPEFMKEFGLEKQSDLLKEENLNYIMNNLIETMKQKWDKYENDYDNIYGEGVYANKFRLPPDDLTSEEQNNSDEYDSDEDNSNEYYSNE